MEKRERWPQGRNPPPLNFQLVKSKVYSTKETFNKSELVSTHRGRFQPQQAAERGSSFSFRFGRDDSSSLLFSYKNLLLHFIYCQGQGIWFLHVLALNLASFVVWTLGFRFFLYFEIISNFLSCSVICLRKLFYLLPKIGVYAYSSFAGTAGFLYSTPRFIPHF